MSTPAPQHQRNEGAAGWLSHRYLRLLTGIVFLVIGGLYLQQTFAIRVPRLGDPLGPRAFPLVMGAVFLGLTLAFLAGTILRREELSDARDMPAQRRAWVSFGLMAGFVLLLPYVGYPVAVALFAMTFLTYLGFGSILINAVIAVVMAAVFKVAFVDWLSLPLPESW